MTAAQARRDLDPVRPPPAESQDPDSQGGRSHKGEEAWAERNPPPPRPTHVNEKINCNTPHHGAPVSLLSL